MDAFSILTRYLYYPLTSRVGKRVIEKTLRVYLHGIPLWTYYENDTFPRLGSYLGHGVCYEASALLMLALRDYNNTRYVFADAPTEKYKRADHAWVELKAYGIWWVLDPTWITSAIPMPNLIYKLLIRGKVTRRVSHQEFFNAKLSQDFAKLIENPSTSYIFNNLTAFRKVAKDRDRRMLWEAYGINCFESQKGKWNPGLVGIFSDKKPITPEVIRDFVVRKKREMPKKRTIRKARTINTKVNRLFQEAAKANSAPS
ncbi:transglutaminase domain-containing protein [Candidatus Saccharibacteria bacterium]|nr:transglutaminase domain-containing protein [Candidatus Saccharibacteria bacterium]